MPARDGPAEIHRYGDQGAHEGRPYVPSTSESRLGTGWEPPALLVLTLVLFCFGLVTIYSASSVLADSAGLPDYHFVVRQAVGGVVGLVALVVCARIDYRRLRAWAWPLLGGAVLLLLLLVLPWTTGIAPEINGARRWLAVGPFSLQPSEPAKLAIIVWTAMLAVKKQDRLASLSRGLLPFLIIWTLVCGLIFLEPNLSGALLVLLLAALVVFAAGARIGHFLLLAAVGLPLVWTQIEGVAYRMRRVMTFLDPSRDPAGASYQIHQSLIAIGSGGLFGRGFGEGRQKFGFLPEPHTDFIFAMIGEEWGFIGLAILVALFGAFALIGYYVARRAPDLFGTLLAIGLTNLIVVQALLHMAVNLALVPTTGLTLPFISYGRTSLVVCMAAVGVLINIAAAKPGVSAAAAKRSRMRPRPQPAWRRGWEAP